jgi:hypothetical protein
MEALRSVGSIKVLFAHPIPAAFHPKLPAFTPHNVIQEQNSDQSSSKNQALKLAFPSPTNQPSKHTSLTLREPVGTERAFHMLFVTPYKVNVSNSQAGVDMYSSTNSCSVLVFSQDLSKSEEHGEAAE